MRELAQQKAPPRPPAQKASSCALARTDGSASNPHLETIALTSAATSGSARQRQIDGCNAGSNDGGSAFGSLAAGGAVHVLVRVERL